MEKLRVCEFNTLNDCILVEIDSKAKWDQPCPPLVQQRQQQQEEEEESFDNVDISLYVPLPFYSIAYKDKSHWQLIQDTLKTIEQCEQLSASTLINSLASYCPEQWDYSALLSVLNNGMTADGVVLPLLEETIPKMAALALQLPTLFPQPIPLLRQNVNCSLTLSQQQVACILANSFFCTFPESLRFGKNYNAINFSSMFSKRGAVNKEKLKCLLYYFHQVVEQMPCGTISIVRNVVSDSPKWSENQCKIGNIEVHSTGTIEDQPNMVHMDFANRYIGGGVLRRGAVQEEIRFMVCPEMIVSCLVCEKMLDSESLRIIGAETFSNYTGYSSKFEWRSRKRINNAPRDKWGHVYSELVAIDALRYNHRIAQFNEQLIHRELLKAYSGFSYATQMSVNWPIATGNWGCGVYNGDLHLKTMIQLMAAAITGRELVYFTFGNLQFAQELSDIMPVLKAKEVTVDRLFNMITIFTASQLFKVQTLFDFLRKELLSSTD